MSSLTRRAVLTGCVGLLAAPALVGRAEAAIALKISTSWSNDPKYSTARIWYDLFLPHLKEETGGQINTLFFPDSQLGQEADVMGQLNLGVVDLMINGSSIWSNIVPEMGTFDLGYAIRDYAHLRRATATPAVAVLEKVLLQKGGVHVPAWLRPAGARNVLTKRGFKDPASLSGQKIRTIPNPTVTETLRLMGAASTPLAFGETYTALQAGVLDGVEHDVPTILTSKFYETAKYLTLTGHIVQPIVVTLSDRSLQRLKPDMRDGLLKAIRKTTDDVYVRFDKLESAAVAELAQMGVTVQDCDKQVFRDRVRPLWNEFVAKTPGAKDVLAAIQQTEAA